MSTQGTDSWLANKLALLNRQRMAQAEAYETAAFHRKSRQLLECQQGWFGSWCSRCRQISRYKFTCKDRLCPFCLEKKLWKLTQALEPILTQVARAKLLTLTVKNTPHLTKPAHTALGRNFKKLRHLAFWLEAVSGGVYGYDCSWTDAGCNEHIHALLDADYLPLPVIRTLWQDYYPGAWNQDIREVDATKGLTHVVKYALRGANFPTQPERLRQYVAVMHGKRTFSTFGSFYTACRVDSKAEKASSHVAHTPAYHRAFGHPPPDLPCLHCGYDLTDPLGYHNDDRLELPPRQLELDHSQENTR